MSKKSLILDLLRSAPNRTMSVSAFIEKDPTLYHKLSSRLSDLGKLGHIIEYIPTENGLWTGAKYWLKFDAERDNDGQLKFA